MNVPFHTIFLKIIQSFEVFNDVAKNQATMRLCDLIFRLTFI